MAKSINKATLLGTMGRDPEVRTLPSGTKVVTLSVATNDRYKDKTGEWKEQTEWHTVVLWRGLAELAQKYLHKGSLVYIEGRLRTRSWEDKEGNKKFATEVVGDNLIMLDKRTDGPANPMSHGPIHHHNEGMEGLGGIPGSDAPPLGEPSEDLPF